MTTDLKISQFADGGAVQPSDEIATNRSGVNTKVFVGTMAAEDASDFIPNSAIGTNIGDVVALEDVGGNPALPSVDGSQLTNVTGLVPVSVDDTTPGNLNDKISIDNSLSKEIENPSSNESLLISVRRQFATPVTIGTGTHTVNINNGDYHEITSTGTFTLLASMENGQALMVRGIGFDANPPSNTFDWGDIGQPDWIGKDDFIIYRDRTGSYIAVSVVTGLS